MPTFLRSDVAVARIAVFEPFAAVEPNDGDTRLYWLRRGRFSDSTITGAMLHKALAGRPSTIRNANTVRKIAAKFPP